MKISFNIQLITAAAVSVSGFIISQLSGNPLYYNLAWVIAGLMFAINPIYPENLIKAEREKAEKGIRIAAIIIILAGICGVF